MKGIIFNAEKLSSILTGIKKSIRLWCKNKWLKDIICFLNFGDWSIPCNYWLRISPTTSSKNLPPLEDHLSHTHMHTPQSLSSLSLTPPSLSHTLLSFYSLLPLPTYVYLPMPSYLCLSYLHLPTYINILTYLYQHIYLSISTHHLYLPTTVCQPTIIYLPTSTHEIKLFPW